MSSPLIIIGMHRSGTTMLSVLLEKAGLFQGWKKEHNNESTFFIGLNNYLLRERGGRWDAPDALVGTGAMDGGHIDLLVEYLADQMRSPRAIEYLGGTNYLKYRSVQGLQCLWGWKDPRTTLNLDIWMRLFPDAKLLHIIRNGVDVAESLRVRSRAALRSGQELYVKRRALYSLTGKRGMFVDSARSLELSGGFGIWEQYVAAATACRERYSERYMELRYEDILAEPEKHTSAIFEFCGLESGAWKDGELKSYFNQDNANKYQLKPELVEFYDSVRERMEVYGY